MMFKAPVLVAAALAASLVAAPLAMADPHDGHGHGGGHGHGDWRGGNPGWHGDNRGGDSHHHGNAVGTAIAGGLLGLGLGAIAGSHAYAPPPVAYPPPYGYAPGYGYSPYGDGY